MSQPVDSGAVFSPDRVHRYSLWRIWDKDKAYAAFVGLNPSTADEQRNDPTVRRCINYAKDWGYGGLVMLNIFAYRSTDPGNLYTATDPVGPENDCYIQSASSKAGITIAAWGNHGEFLSRGGTVIDLLTSPHCLKLTKAGCPGHPLYLRKDLQPFPFRSTAAV
ncbi:MAG: DUF1643 domain-containing protein [Candidatus Sabulitectum sp.]|nr:DUF1643 domain-containing protein [Candidatus Sabulitectum sp.]